MAGDGSSHTSTLEEEAPHFVCGACMNCEPYAALWRNEINSGLTLRAVMHRNLIHSVSSMFNAIVYLLTMFLAIVFLLATGYFGSFS